MSPSPVGPARRVSIKDVAVAAGVSTQTVSRVVNGVSAVAPETRERVEQVIASLGYRRNELARNLIQGRTRTLGVVFAGQDFLGGRQVNSGITAEAETLGYSILLKERRREAQDTGDELIHALLERQVDGILWMLSDICGDHASLLQRIVHEHGVPVVALVMSRSVGVPFSAFDNYGAGVIATRHLIERGRRRIGHIAGPAGSWDGRERLRGWRDAMQEAGLACGDELVHIGNWRPDGGMEGLAALRERVPDLDAAFCANDHTALGAMLAAHRLGLRIPQDVAFVGVDNVKGSAWYYPPLTTVRQNQVAMGRQAVKMLSRLVEARFAGNGGVSVEDYLHAPELIVRESS